MVSYILYRTGQFLALFLPLKIGYGLAVLISDIRYIFAYQDRRIVRENLKAVFPEKSGREISRIRINIFRNFAKYLVDFFRFSRIDKDYIKKHVRLEKMDNFDQALKKGKGVIVLTAHFGNWELGGIVIALSGYPFWAVVLPHKHERENRFFDFQRQRKGVKVIHLGHAVRGCLNALRDNEMVALVGDRNFTGSGIIVDFFNKPTVFPEGPAAFYLKTGAPIVPGFMFRNKDDSFTLRIEQPLEFQATGDKKEDLKKLTALYKGIFERYIRQNPEQWYMFRKFWQ